MKAQGTDFDHAVAFQIRLASTPGDVTLTLDQVPNANVQTFYVEEAEGTTGDPLTLALKTTDGGAPLTVWQRVIAAARLDVSNDRKSNALNLRPLDGRHTPIHRGNSDRGAYIVGTSRVDWDFGAESSVPRLEVVPGAELTFAVGQNFRRYGTTLVAQGKDERTFPDEGSDEGPTMEDMMGGAWIHHTSNAPFLGQDIELGEGAYLGFHAEAEAQASAEREEGVVLAGKLRLTGNATLRADYEHGALYAFSGISAFHAADEAATAEGRTYIDAHNFYVAYEFGVSRMAFATIDGEEHVVVEVKVQNALADTFGEAFAEGAAAEPAAFRSGTTITLQAMKNGQIEALPTDDITVTEVADLAGKQLAARAADVRYFALPYEALLQYFGTAPILLRPSATNPVELGAQ